MSYYDIFEREREDAINYMDNKNRAVLEKWCEAIGYKRPIGYYNKLSENKIIIYAERPGLLIGKAGVYVNLLKEILKREFNHDYSVEFVEIKGKIININPTEE